MPVAISANGSPSASKRWRLSIRITGLPSNENLGAMWVWIGQRADATVPETPGDLIAGTTTAGPVGQVGWNAVKALTRVAGEGVVAVSQILQPEDELELAVGNYLTVGITDDDSPDSTFLATSPPLRVRA